MPGITGVWCHEAGMGALLNVVSLRTAYSGHSKQAAVIASQLVRNGRFTIVVDEDVDPSNLEDVMWAAATRAAEPERAIDIIRYCRSSNVDPSISIERKLKTPHLFTSHAIIDACRPYEWKQECYPIAQISPELRDKLLKKWATTLKAYL